jgi:hypothetical protein
MPTAMQAAVEPERISGPNQGSRQHAPFKPRSNLPQAPPPQAPAAYVPPVVPVYNSTARIEYLYLQLQNGSCTTAGNCGVDAAGVAANDTVKFNTSLVRLGLDYKFRWPILAPIGGPAGPDTPAAENLY